jgi:hypothetical protein
MSATKKQVNDLENAVVILEERLEKMEEEQQLLKQMISMQSTLIDNLQMMMKMMSSVSVNPTTYKVMHVGGQGSKEREDHQENSFSEKEEHGSMDENIQNEALKQVQEQMRRNSIKSMKHRVSRIG